VPKLTSLHETFETFRNNTNFYGGGLFAPRPTPKLEEHPFPVVRDCLFNIFTATDSQNSDTTAPSGRELCHLQFLLQVASPETFGYTLIVTYVTSLVIIQLNSVFACQSVSYLVN
jgi:hypothetical protein